MPAFSHNVFFTLTDDARGSGGADELVAGAKEYLPGHDGVVFFACGTREEAMQRDVNDRDFDVALVMVFASKAEHDAYQTAERHGVFIEKCKHLWQTVRVFDAAVAAHSLGE